MALRMRVFAEPNGSGKTTIIDSLRDEIGYGVYVNADDIERTLQAGRVLLFDSFQLQIDNDSLIAFFKKSTFSPVKRNEANLWKKLHVDENVRHVSCEIDSYLSADLASFIREQLLRL